MNIRRLSGTERYFDILIYAVLILWGAFIIFPLLYILMTSFATEKDYLTRGFFIIPREWTWDAYLYLLANDSFTKSFMNAVIITVVGTTISISATTLMAYGLSKKWLKGRNVFNFMVVFTMLFSGGLIPTYLVIKEFGMIDTFWSLWLPGAVAPFYLIVMRSFFSSIPFELEESARVDGCGEWRMFFSIMLPLSKASIATFVLFYMVGYWNTYFSALIYLNDSGMWPLQVFLRQILVLNQSLDESATLMQQEIVYTPGAKMAAIVVSALPMMVIYPFLQKHFNKGMLLGSLKG
ncbi:MULTISPECIES: carbohydrate ABC transporter permease [unclassified Paenibacillus]|uniref:carbohydrate ABC transporter permease n=1 Tax=unclassified Paenibacillus TaxID=185978 RepID=UPI00278AC0EC|nr:MULTISPECIES: carbohydrate ABC transporter permease [unclassified Paenibacillus]MDQ0901070.1 putative aldouronate transport system permease protein [Paenibacillus sp. V4I7]MDQ0920430.1 putative aldouronate transport system permease protein [Paenibacillus sp. V4I5]